MLACSFVVAISARGLVTLPDGLRASSAQEFGPSFIMHGSYQPERLGSHMCACLVNGKIHVPARTRPRWSTSGAFHCMLLAGGSCEKHDRYLINKGIKMCMGHAQGYTHNKGVTNVQGMLSVAGQVPAHVGVCGSNTQTRFCNFSTRAHLDCLVCLLPLLSAFPTQPPLKRHPSAPKRRNGCSSGPVQPFLQ